MADYTQASFIPKSPSGGTQPRVRRQRRIYLFAYVSYVVFFGTVLAGVGLYLYAAQIHTALSTHKQELAVLRDRFNDADIDRVRTLEQKILTAQRLLDGATAPSGIFREIEPFVSSAVIFTSFEYKAGDNNTAEVTLKGVTDSFNSALFQENELRRSSVFASSSIEVFDYALVEESDTEDKSLASSGTKTISFQVSQVVSTDLIPYVPATPEASEVVVTDVRAGLSTESGTDSGGTGVVTP